MKSRSVVSVWNSICLIVLLERVPLLQWMKSNDWTPVMHLCILCVAQVRSSNSIAGTLNWPELEKKFKSVRNPWEEYKNDLFQIYSLDFSPVPQWLVRTRSLKVLKFRNIVLKMVLFWESLDWTESLDLFLLWTKFLLESSALEFPIFFELLSFFNFLEPKTQISSTDGIVSLF